MSARIDDLEPVTRALCEAWQHDCAAAGLPVKLAHTRRTMDEQAHQWAKGRDIPSDIPCWHSDGQRPVGTCQQHPLGAIVTKARPGQSPHNFGAAFDWCFDGRTHGECYPPLSDPRWLQVGRIGERLGLSWGGPLGAGDRFVNDRPHFERADWKTLRDARSIV